MANIIVGIDTGGTFTDGFLSDGTRIAKIKVDTTPHDLTVCFMECLKEGARAFGFADLRSFLKEVQVLRFSSTTSTNILAQKTGDKVGMLVTKGFEDNLYAKDEGILYDFLVSRDLVEAVDEEVSWTGKIVQAPTEGDIMERVKRLLDQGARIIVISFHNAHLNNENEATAKEIINTYYPKHYLGSLPIIPANKFCNHPDEAGRTNIAVLNAYVHRKVSGSLYHAEDLLRESGYRKPLLLVNSNGGCSRVAKTRAADVIGSSPTAGYIGAIYWAKKYGLSNVVTIDIGGTSIDIGLIVDGQPLYSEERRLFDTPIPTPVWDVASIGLGGGSIARMNPNTKDVQVGPESAGALPGPACYELGGENPTITDADVVLNRIDPGYFLGGRRRLNTELAREAIGLVAEPLGVRVEEAAVAILDKATDMWAAEIKRMLDAIGQSPDRFALFAYGGGGATHCCEIAAKLGISTIFTFPFSSTFGAFGTSMMDMMHIYMRYMSLPLSNEGTIVLDLETFNKVVREEQEKALRDMIGEGFRKEDVRWELQLEIDGGSEGRTSLVTSPKVVLGDVTDAEAILKNYAEAIAKSDDPGRAGNNSRIEVFYLESSCPLFKYEFQRATPGERDPGHAYKSERVVSGPNWSASTKVYDADLLGCGNVIRGPAILESVDTTLVLPELWQFSVDEFLNGIIRKGE